jgi:hypothetical protein
MRALVPPLQAELARSGGNDGRAGVVVGSHHDHALGEAVYIRVRQTLESFCHAGGAVMAR